MYPSYWIRCIYRSLRCIHRSLRCIHHSTMRLRIHRFASLRSQKSPQSPWLIWVPLLKKIANVLHNRNHEVCQFVPNSFCYFPFTWSLNSCELNKFDRCILPFPGKWMGWMKIMKIKSSHLKPYNGNIVLPSLLNINWRCFKVARKISKLSFCACQNTWTA